MDASFWTSTKEGSLKKALALFSLLLFLGVAVGAQELGSIKGTVKDKEGNPLPGVAVSLTGVKTAPFSIVTSPEGNFRFLYLAVANDYTLKCELQGFKPYVRTQLVVSYGRDVTLDITMEQATIEETVTVVGQTPVIDTKRTQVGVNITEDMIMSLPTSLNSWTLLNLVPGMLLAREDVGGSEAGQQYGYTGHGSYGQDNTWNIDGANVTDMSALGAASSYYNPAGYEEVQVNYGNNDVKSQTGGVQINFVTKRGGNAYSGTFYLNVEDKAWQSSNVSDTLKNFGYANPGVDRVYLYGINFGGPIVKDKAWFYGSWGVQDLNIITLAGRPDKTWLASGYGKVNFQLTRSTRAELFIQYDNKLKWGRNDYYEATVLAPETYWNQDGPTYLYKAEFDQSFGNLFMNLKGIYQKNTFYLHPYAQAANMPLTISYFPTYLVSGAMDDYGTVRENYNLIFTGDYFAEKVLGGDHDLKFGVDYLFSTVTSFDFYEGNVVRYYNGPDDTMPTGQSWYAEIRRDVKFDQSYQRFGIFAQDTMKYGKLSINLGLRYDNEKSIVKNQIVPASPFLTNLLPGLEIKKLDPGATYKEFSPRISFIYDLFGTGKDVLKLSLARYGAQSGYSMASFVNPMGWGGIGVMWQDGYQNFIMGTADGTVQASELYGVDADGALTTTIDPATILWSWGVNIYDPTSVEAFNKIDPKYNTPYLDELSLSYEKELFTDFRASAEFYYKKSHHNTWDIGMNPDGTLDSQLNYTLFGTDPVTQYPVYDKIADFYYTYRTNYHKRYADYIAGQLVFTKRLTRRWMLDASVTLSSWKDHYKGEYTDPQNVTYYDLGANSSMNSRWQVKISGLYQLPYDINLSTVFRAREGYVRGTYVRISDIPNIGSRSVYGNLDGGGKYGDQRLPSFYEIDLRIEKVFKVSERSRVTLSAESFNAFNSPLVLARQNLMSSFTWGDTPVTNVAFGRTTNILNPRVFRFGARFDF
jgi:hypothetical protein